jgi:hypothetical protein
MEPILYKKGRNPYIKIDLTPVNRKTHDKEICWPEKWVVVAAHDPLEMTNQQLN